MRLTFQIVDDRVQAVIAAQPLVFNVREIPYIGRHFAQMLSQAGIFSTADLVRIAAARSDPAVNMNNTQASRSLVVGRLREFISSVAEAPRGAQCVGNYYDANPVPGRQPNPTYLVRDINPGAFWALVSTLKRLWPNNPNRAACIAAVAALTGGAARFLRRADITALHASVQKPRAAGVRSNAAAATCICRRNPVSCQAPQVNGAALCQWFVPGGVAQGGLPNWPLALAGVCIPHPNLRPGSAEPLPGRTKAVERVPYPPAGQAASIPFMGSGGIANARLARYTRDNRNFQFRNFI